MACLSPIDVRRPAWALVRLYISVPCGKCVGCRLERARNWTIRIMNEAQMHKENSFLTLTYKDEELTYGYKQATLVKTDLQKFWKRLRKEIKREIRYFACGEYGEQRSRPHYHAALFGFDFKDKTIISSKDGCDLYNSDTLNRIWTHGNCAIGALTPRSAAYVARYILDKKFGKEAREYEEKGVEPEFVVMSRGSGIGKTWFKRYGSDIFPEDRLVQADGSITRPPRYYDELYKTQNPQEMQNIKIKRMKAAEEVPQNERLARRMLSKIRFHESRVKKFNKKLHN